MPNIERLESDIERALMSIFRKEIKHPDIQFITITNVDLTNDLSYLTIHYTTLDDEQEKRDATQKALEQSNKFIRTALAQKVKMRKMPQLRFKYDTTLEHANRIERGLKEVMDKNNKNNDE